MKYKLAKQLKETGFPFKAHHLGTLHLDGSTPASYPTLSELIEACGDGFYALYKVKGGYRADGYRKTRDGEEELGTLFREECVGSNSEEAVANLWLALNK